MRKVVLFASIALLTWGSSSAVLAGSLDPDLSDVFNQADNGEAVSTLVYLWDQIDLDELNAKLDAQNASRELRHETVVTAMQELAFTKQASLVNALDGMLAKGDVEYYEPYWIANVIRVDATPEVIKSIASRRDVFYVYPNYSIEGIKPVSVGQVEGASSSRAIEVGVAAIHAPEAWALGYDGTDILVATLDTGVDGTHPALADRWRGLDPRYDGNPDWAWFDPVTNTTFPESFGSHGTHTMGTVCGGVPGDEVGVAPGAQWIHAGVIDRVDIPTTVSDAILAFEWMVDPDSNPTTAWDVPHVCSNSWGVTTGHGYPECDETFWTYLDNLEAAGVIVLFSAGNEGSSANTLRRPSDRATNIYNVCSVGAVDEHTAGFPVASFSSRGPSYCTPDGEAAIKPDVAAPGVDTRSAMPGGGYGTMSGTSMASPHVNGVVALVVQACPDLTVEEVKQVLYDTAIDLGPVGEDNDYGRGMVDAELAVLLALDLCVDSEGRVEFDREVFMCEDTVEIIVADTDLNTDPGVIETVNVMIASKTEPAGEPVTLYEVEADGNKFSGTINVSVSNSAGVLQVTNGDVITATYIDADDGMGGYNITRTVQAPIDCDPPQISNVASFDIEPRAAKVSFDSNEDVWSTVYYGLSCDNLTGEATSQGYSNPAITRVKGLQDNNTYFYSVMATDEAGNSATDDNGGACYSFSTPEIPDFFTEQFESGLDVDGMQLFFIPNGSFDYYKGCNYSNLTTLPTDPTGGTALSLTDDDTQEISLAGGAQVYIYGQAYSSVWICSNGHLTFGVEDDEHIETLEDHFSNPRVAALFDDLNPVDGGTISYKQLSDRFVVTWENVPQYNTTGDSNTFQAELFFDGMITLSYLGIGTSDAIIGLSDGSGLDPDFYPSDLSNMGICGERPPSASGGSAHADLNTAITIDLIAGDDGLPDPPAALTYIITALPANGTLSDPGAGAIASVPYTLVGGGNAVVYSPSYNYQGPDSLQYKANDGGIAPDGGDSNIATVSITVGGPAAVHSFPLDSDPMWTTEGQWAFGQPTGEGSHNLDPTEGYTGSNVYGYNLEGDYPHSMGEMDLTTGAMDCTDVTGVELHFWRWLGVESATYDHARIDVSNDGTNWVLVWDHTSTTAISDSSWNEMIYDVSAVADNQPTVFFRWVMGVTDTSVSYPGWNIDDIAVWGIVPLTECPFDLDGSGFVGTGDINLIKANYGAVTPETEAFDLDGSGFVGTGDINLIKANYGPCP